MNERKILTGISKVNWCDENGNFGYALLDQMGFAANGKKHVAWLDVLLEGGLTLPPEDESKKPLMVLLRGRPGSGKSTLALEMAYRWALGIHQLASETGQSTDLPGWDTLYVTSEGGLGWARHKAQKMSWPESQHVLHNYERRRRESKEDVGRVLFYESKSLSLNHPVILYHADHNETHEDSHDFLKVLAHGVTAIALGNPLHLITGVPDVLKIIEAARRGRGLKSGPELIVFDSLNTLISTDRQEILGRQEQMEKLGAKVIIVVLNSDGAEEEVWDYRSDLVIELGTATRPGSDYMTRTIEIKKARFQSHVWNKQQLKIYSPSTKKDDFQNDDTDIKKQLARRQHPFCQEGGVFLFPSIHFYLSRYKRESPTDKPTTLSSSLPRLDELLGKGGFPGQRCTGLVGIRGGHKSHLGYRCLLSQLTKDGGDSKALIVSLRDDEGTAMGTLDNILKSDLNRAEWNSTRLMNGDKMELLYFPPGNITPEEVYHRIYVSIQRLKQKCDKVIVLFNSLDQLQSRFPLCAAESIFVPGIIETLTAEKVTSLIIGVEEPGQPEQQFGLLSMADLLIRFDRKKMSTAQYKSLVTGKPVDPLELQPFGKVEPVVLKVVRFAGGQAAGASGMLELLERPMFLGDKRTGLHFTPFGLK